MDKNEKKKAAMLLVILGGILWGGVASIMGMKNGEGKPDTEETVLPQQKADAEAGSEKTYESSEDLGLEMLNEPVRMREEKIGELEGDFGQIWHVGDQQEILTMGDRFNIWTLEDAGLQPETVCEFPEGGFARYAFLDREGHIWSLWTKEGQEDSALIQYDRESGEKLCEIELKTDDVQIQAEIVQNMYVDDDWIYIVNKEQADQYALMVFDHDGQLACVKENVRDMEWIEDGRLLLYCNRPNNRLVEVCVENGQIAEKSAKAVEMTGSASRLHYASDEGAAYLLTGNEIIGLQLEEEDAQPEKLMSFSGDALGISADYAAADFYVSEDGTVFVLYYVYGGERIGREIWRYEMVEQQEREQVLTVSIAYPMPVLDAAVKFYEEKYPDRQVKLEPAYRSLEEYQEYSEGYMESMAVRLMTGDYGDILLSSHGVYSWDKLAGDAFEDLSGWITETENYENLDKNILKAAQVQGRLSGVPVALNHTYYVANRELALAADQNGDGELTWSELLKQAASWEEEETGYSLFGSGNQVELSDLLASNLYDLIDPGKKTMDLKQEWFLDLMRLYKQVYDSYDLSVPETVFVPDEAHVLFEGMDKGAMLYRVQQFTRGRITGSFSKDAEFFYEDEAACGCNFMMLKDIAGEQNANYSDFPMLFFSLNPAAKERQAALDFLEILLSEKVQERLDYNLLPVSESARKNRLEQAKRSGVPLTEREFDLFYESMENTVSQVAWLYSYGYYLADLNEAMQAYVDGRLELEDAVAQAEQKIWIRMNE